MSLAAAITGAAGFLGAHLVRGFEARGARVVPLVRAVGAGSPAGARALEEALSAPETLEGLDVLVHAAAVRHRFGVEAGEYRASNVDLVERTMRACSGRVRRFVLVSSVGVYGFPARLPVTEEHPYAPRTLYSATKVEAEVRARRLAPELGVELVIVRPTIVYGPGDRNGMLDKMASMIRMGAYRVVGDGENVLHHTHVDDIVEGVWLAATHPAAVGDATDPAGSGGFILAGPETITLGELSALVARAVGRELPKRRVPAGLARAVATVIDLAADRGMTLGGREPPVNHEKLDVMTLPICFDAAKARRVLGFAPRVRYEEGVMRTLRGEWPSVARAGADA
jgi:nucleoside-diphosphate-sugar epimerase